MPKTSLSTCHVEFSLGWESCEHLLPLVIITTTALVPFRLATSSRGGIFVSISLKYTFLTIHLHKWNKINVTYFEYRYTLQMFLHILEKSACFGSCVRLAGWIVMSD